MPGQLTVTRALVPSFSRLDDAAEAAHYWGSLLAMWKVPRRLASRPGFFPACNPKSIARCDLAARHSDGPYVVAHKSDGVRYVLMLTLRPNSREPIALMVDRARNMFEVEVVAHEDFFVRGTLLEGELVWKQPDERAFLYLVFDAVRIKGEYVGSQAFRDRLAALDQCVRLSEELSALPHAETEERAVEEGSIVLCHYQPSVAMRTKRFVGIEFASRLWTERAEAEHRVDGLIVQCAAAAYGSDVFKWKEHSTIDLRGPEARCGDAPLADAEFPVRIDPSSRVRPENDDDVVEYLIGGTRADVTLFAVRRRPDKTVANSLMVVNSTIRDAVVDNVRPDELCQFG